MAAYTVHVTTDVADVSDDELDDLVDALAPVAGVPSMLGGRLSVHMTVEADSLGAGLEAAALAVAAAARAVVDGGAVVAVEATLQDEAELDHRVVAEWDPAGWWVVTVPDVPGGITQSRRLDEVPADAAEVIAIQTAER